MTLVQDAPPLVEDDHDPPAERASREARIERIRRRIGLFGGVALFAGMLLLPPPEGLSEAGWRTAAAGVLMAVWWITEALPIAATSLVPLALFPMLGIATIHGASAPYANPLIFLFLGGFIIALAMEKWGLHRRIALNIVRGIGTRPYAIVAGFMVSCAFISMWVSNTATALMMLPIALSIVAIVDTHRDASGSAADTRNFSTMLMLTIAYASSIGGLATLIGTPGNALLAGFLDETYGLRISFAEWFAVGLPLVLVGLPLTYLTLRLLFPVRMASLPGGADLLHEELRKLGRISRPETMVAAVFGIVAMLWITSPLLQSVLPGISDTGIAMLGALALFILPANTAKGEFVMDWKTAERLPWGVLLLFGGGLSLASAIQGSGLAVWIGGELGALAGWPTLLVVLAITAVIVMLTELTSNTATAAAFLPIVSAVAIGIGENPLLLAIPTVLASSCAFMLPVATPPNAIVYGSGAVSIGQMARTGMWLNLIFTLLITLLTYTLVLFVLDVTPGVLPEWAIPE